MPGLYIFDVDDTLLKTTARVGVIDQAGQISRYLSTSDYNIHQLGIGESYDFSEFEDSTKFLDESQPLADSLLTFRRIQEKIDLKLLPGSKVILNTARGEFDNREVFLSTFIKHGIKIADEDVHLAGNVRGNLSGSQKKLVIIRKYLGDGTFTEAFMYDDGVDNLIKFLTLKNEFPQITFHAYIQIAGKGFKPFRISVVE